MNLESPKVNVAKSAEYLFNALNDVKNFEKLMPENIAKFEVIDENCFEFGLKGMPEIKLVKKGGKLLLFYWLLCGFLSLMQNVIGVSLAQVFDIDPLLGVLMGAVSMEGGHGAAGAFGPTVEALGVYGATAVALAAATFGLVSGGLVGGPVAKYLIGRYNLKSTESEENISVDEAEGG